MADTQRGQSLESLSDELYESGATDGLPIVPPTEERVDEMVRGTELPRDEELAVLGERQGSLTVEKLAANAVMAGGNPTYMPVLIAAARAMGEERSTIAQAAVDTGSWAFQWVINGPIRSDIDIRSNTGAFGPGFRANRAIGRALGLAYQNTALIDPRYGDESVHGNPFKYTLVGGENEDQSPWEPYHVSAGYDEEDSTITFFPRRSWIQFIPYGMSAKGVLKAMQTNTIPEIVGRDGDIPRHVVHQIGPYNAEELDAAGLTKQEVKEYLCDNSDVQYERIAAIGGEAGDDAGWAGKVEPIQTAQIEDPELIQLFVIGGSGRFNALGHTLGAPITTRIDLPDEWDSLVEEYAVEREWGEITDTYDATSR